MEEELHEMYSVSATVHAIKRRHKINTVELAKQIGINKSLVSMWQSGKQAMGIRSYNKVIELFPEFRGRIDYGNTYYKG